MRKIRKSSSRKNGFISVGIILALSAALLLGGAFLTYDHAGGSSYSSANGGKASQFTQVTYLNNGLSCAFPSGTPSYVITLVPQIVQSPKFQAEANGSLYVYAYTDNITSNSMIVGGTYENGVVVGGTTEQLPLMIELAFYTSGAATTCNIPGALQATHLMMVQIPIEGSAIDLNAATYHVEGTHF